MAGNSGNSYVILDSTELLIHGEWQAGKSLTKNVIVDFNPFVYQSLFPVLRDISLGQNRDILGRK